MNDRTWPQPHAGSRHLPLVGREREQAELRTYLKAVLNSQGTLVLIGGEAGIGKTTLVDALAREATEHGALVLIGHCYDLTTTPPYGPWTEIAGSYHPDNELPPLPNALKDIEAIGALGSQSALFEEARAFFTRLAQSTPLVLVLEDMHWADQASLDLLRYLARQIGDLPLLLLTTYRDDEITRRHPLYQLMPSLVREAQAQRIDLHRLETGAIHQLVGSRYQLDGSDSDRLVTYLQSHAEGNPFYAGELLRTLEDEGLLAASEDGWTLEDPERVHLPPLVRQVVDQRLAKLGIDNRALLETAAIIGQVVPLDLWRATSDATDDQFATTVERAIEGHIVEETLDRAGLRFTHALVRKALYEGLVLPRRRTQHLRIAETIEGYPNAHPDAVAYHYEKAGDDRAVEWLVRAGEVAQRSYAWSIAAERFQTAISILESNEGRVRERGWLRYRVARLLRFRSSAQCIAYLEEAERLAIAGNDQVLAAYALVDRGLPRAQSGDIQQGISEMEAGLATLDSLSAGAWSDVDSRVASWVADALPVVEHQANEGGKVDTAALTSARRGVLVLWLANVGRYHDALAIGEPFVNASQRTRDVGAYGDAMLGLGIVYCALGRPLQAQNAFASARSAFQSIGHHLLSYETVIKELRHMMLTFWPDQVEKRWSMIARGEEAASLAREMIVPHVAINVTPIAVLFVEGRWAEARQIAEQPGVRSTLLNREVTDSVYGAILRAQGDNDRAWNVVSVELPEGPETEPGGTPTGLYSPLQRLAIQLSLDAGQLSEARLWLEAHDRWLDWSGSIVGQAEGQLLWARYYHSSGDRVEAHRSAINAHALASEPRQPLILLRTHRFLGMLDSESGRYSEAEDHFRDALTLADACAAPFERAPTLVDLASLRGRIGDTTGALESLDEAKTICAPLDAQPTLAAIEARRAELTANQIPVRYPAGLTQREVDVLQLVALGLTDAEVADRLYVSRRTVTSHLTSIYTKLGVSSRAAATRFAVEKGLTS